MAEPAKPVENPNSSTRLQRFRERYERVNQIVRGDARERTSHQADTLQDWLPHRKETGQ